MTTQSSSLTPCSTSRCALLLLCDRCPAVGLSVSLVFSLAETSSTGTCVALQILHPKVFIYSCVNLPLILSKLLQAQLRNVAGSLELDQMIQDAAQVSGISPKALESERAELWLAADRLYASAAVELTDVSTCATQLNVLTGLLDMEAQRWGVQIQFVKVQQVKCLLRAAYMQQIH